MLLLRGFLGTGGIVGLFVAIQLLPLADVSAIGLLIPVFVSVAAPLALGEGAARGSLAALPLCAAGVLLVAQPSFLFGASAEPLPALGLALAVLQVRDTPATARPCLAAPAAAAKPLGGVCHWFVDSTKTAGCPAHPTWCAQAAVVAANKLVVRSLGGTEPVPSIMMSMAGKGEGEGKRAAALPTLHRILRPARHAVLRSPLAWPFWAQCRGPVPKSTGGGHTAPDTCATPIRAV